MIIEDFSDLIKSRYQALDEKAQRRIYYILYTAMFSVCVMVIFKPFFNDGITLIWKQDGYPHYYTNLVYMRNWLIESLQGVITGNIAWYDFNIGLGNSISSVLANPGLELINIFVIFFSEEKIELFYGLALLVRFYLSGITFSVFAFSIGKKYNATFAGAFIYIFCGYTMSALRHPQFITALVLLPLILLGIERIITHKGSKFLVIAVCISTISSYYFFYMNTLAAGMYILIRILLPIKKGNWKELLLPVFRVVRSYLLGVTMGAVILLPNIFLYLDSNRLGTVLSTPGLFDHGDGWIEKMFLGFVFPNLGVGSWLVYGFPPIAVYCVYLLFIKGKKYVRYQVAIVIGIAISATPALALLMTGFGNVTHRWCYIFSMVIGLAYVEMVPEILKASKKELLLLFCGIIPYLWYCKNVTWMKNSYFAIGMLFLLLTYIVILVFARTSGLLAQVVPFVLTVLVCANVAIYGNICFDEDYGDMVSLYAVEGNAESTFTSSSDAQLAAIADDGFWRAEKYSNSWMYSNAGRLLGYNSVSTGESVPSQYWISYNEGLESAGWNSSIGIFTLDARTYLGALANVKYFITGTDQGTGVPYGYMLNQNLTDSDSKYSIYENQYALPIGYTYDSYILESEYNQMNPIDKQTIMMSSVVLEESINSTNGYITTENNGEKVAWSITEANDVEINGSTIVVSKANGTITLQFQGIESSETYVRLEGYSSATRYSISMESILGTKSVQITPDTYTYTKNTENYMINLGYSEEALTEVTIKFPTKGTYNLNAIEIYCQPMDLYPELISELETGCLENVVIGTNSVSGTSYLEEDRIMCFGILYSSGWSATVDGEPVELLRANVMYMAIPLSAGYHEIELIYMIPGLVEGAILSVVSISFFVGCHIVRKRKTKIEEMTGLV